jgi:hypothetical protein
MTVARELARYRLDLVGVQEVTWDKAGKRNEIILFLAGYFLHQRTISAVRRVC